MAEEFLFFDNRITCEWMTSKEAARYLGISPNALRIWVCRGKVKSYKLGRFLRFHLKDIQSLLQPNG